MTVCKQRFPTKIIESREDLWLNGNLTNFISGLGQLVTSAVLKVPVLTVKKPRATCSHIQWLAPSQGALDCPGLSPSEGLSTDPRLLQGSGLHVNHHSSTQLLLSKALSCRRLQCPGRPTKVLNLKKMAQLSQAPPESKCARFSLFLSSCSEQGALLCTIFSHLLGS